MRWNRLAGARALAVAATIALASCATVPKQAYNRTAHPDIKVVGVIAVAPTAEYTVANLGHPGQAFGLIGAAIAISDMQSKSTEFTAAAKARGLDVAASFQERLVAAIEARGYRVKIVKAERPKAGFLERYDGLDADADAYVDATISAGYACASSTADYFPIVLSGVRIVKRGSREIAYNETIAYGYEWKYGQPVQIPADPKYRFKDFAAIMADVPVAVEGLTDGVPKVIAQIERDLSR